MKKIFSLVVALLTLISCSEDFLNLTPQYYPNDATFFKTQEQFTQAVNRSLFRSTGSIGKTRIPDGRNAFRQYTLHPL